LILVQKNEDLKNYSKIFDFLNIAFFDLENYSNFVDLILNKN
jgi:hypothetical protein